MSDIPPETFFRSLSSLPEPGLFVDILSRLPVKTLLRFRSVSKSWRAFIDTPYFIKKHITHSIKTNTNFNLVFVSIRYIYISSFGTRRTIRIMNPLFSSFNDDHGTNILGSCNGVLCISTSWFTNKEIGLLNPSTREFKTIPLSPVNFPIGASRRFCVEGFGYDCVNDDYKVVRVVQYIHKGSGNTFVSDIWVYSLKSGLWRWVGGFPYLLWSQRSYSVLASGCLHWVVCEKPESDSVKDIAIVAFDLGTEKYRIVPKPKFSFGKLLMNLDVISGYLCVVCEYDYGAVDVWVMESYGVEESWYKLISIPTAMKDFERLRLLAYYSGEGKVLMEEDNEKIAMYDIKTNRVKRALHNLETPFFANVDIGSLVQLNSGSVSGSDEKKQQAKGEKEEERKG